MTKQPENSKNLVEMYEPFCYNLISMVVNEHKHSDPIVLKTTEQENFDKFIKCEQPDYII